MPCPVARQQSYLQSQLNSLYENMESELQSSVLSALQTLQQDLLGAHSENAASRTGSITQKLSQLSSSIQDLLQRQSVLEQTLENRGVAERALRNVIANKEAESARLRSEISRLRHTLAANTAADTVLQGAQAQIVAAAACEDSAAVQANARKAVLDTAIAAKNKPIALVLQLESEVSACQARINNLESELASAAADHSSRLCAQQQSFLAKLEQLRQVHNQQLTAAMTAAEAEAKEQLQQQQTQHEQQLNQVQQQLVQQQTLIALLQQQQQEQAKQVLDKASDSSRNATVVPAQQSSNNTENQDVSRQQPEAQSGGPASTVPSTQAPDVGQADQSREAAALQLMEQQLVRLSGIIKTHQVEMLQLRQALMAGAAERQQLQQQVQQLTSQQQTTLGVAQAAATSSGGKVAAVAGAAKTAVATGGPPHKTGSRKQSMVRR